MQSILRSRMLILMLVLTFLGTSAAFSQESEEIIPETEELTDEIDAIDESAELDQTALLTKLSVQFRVELSVLEELRTQGYSTGQIWLALEISQYSGVQLSEAMVNVVNIGSEGHGWSVLARSLGVDPGSAQFFQLKEQMRARTRTMVSEVDAEHGNKIMVQKKTEKNEKQSLENNGNKGNKR